MCMENVYMRHSYVYMLFRPNVNTLLNGISMSLVHFSIIRQIVERVYKPKRTLTHQRYCLLLKYIDKVLTDFRLRIGFKHLWKYYTLVFSVNK